MVLKNGFGKKSKNENCQSLREYFIWSLVLGRFGDRILLSVRTTQTRANAGHLTQKLVAPLGSP